MASNTGSDREGHFDVIGNLPPEVASYILRMVDTETLVSGAAVCRRYRTLIRADPLLRGRVRDYYKRKRNRERKPGALRCSRRVHPYAPTNDQGEHSEVQGA
ncbi:uncharacterized protein LOC124158116 [Ischnura elegans]|uniref:uncharacterized protein LOC124158116 n=1 Tax=Ischnura elegans TaxID=197161 RepID=UPI001ED89BEC|nr:uncharacterized protein LOC124158116 [Ischnura elegans]